MSEPVTVTPQSGRDDDGNPIASGVPAVVQAFAVAPGNTTLKYTEAGNVDNVDFTLYFNGTVAINDGDRIQVRGSTCTARVQVWDNPYSNYIGTVVLCESFTGAT